MRPGDAVLLAAGIGDLLDKVVPALFVIAWLAVQVISAFRKAGKAQPPGRLPQAPPAPPPRRPQGRPPEIDSEIEELLRRTLGVEPARQPPPLPPPRPPKQPKQKQKQRKQEGPGSSKLATFDSRGSRSDSIARHVEEAFAHDLAHESPSGTASQPRATVAVSPTAELIASLRSPEDLRRLMIVREILDVPSHRW